MTNSEPNEHQQTSLFAEPSAASETQQTLAASNNTLAPLAAQLRPKTLADYVGQQHILGINSPLKQAIEQGGPGHGIYPRR